MTVEPVTLSGWYRNTDDTWSFYQWRSGRLHCDQTVATGEETWGPGEREAFLEQMAEWERYQARREREAGERG